MLLVKQRQRHGFKTTGGLLVLLWTETGSSFQSLNCTGKPNTSHTLSSFIKFLKRSRSISLLFCMLCNDFQLYFMLIIKQKLCRIPFCEIKINNQILLNNGSWFWLGTVIFLTTVTFAPQFHAQEQCFLRNVAITTAPVKRGTHKEFLDRKRFFIC